jgi:hypothetical protein
MAASVGVVVGVVSDADGPPRWAADEVAGDPAGMADALGSGDGSPGLDEPPAPAQAPTTTESRTDPTAIDIRMAPVSAAGKIAPRSRPCAAPGHC